MNGGAVESGTKGWLTLRECAIRLARPYASVLKLVDLGLLPARRTESGRFFIREQALRAYVAEQRALGLPVSGPKAARSD
jgi:hypothetical protein